MGALHQGHLELIKKARRQSKKVVVSIFVNPTQFGPKEDYKKYPRTFSRDKELCRRAGVDLLFYPKVTEVYPPGEVTYVNENKLTDALCGRSRPGHFRGVMTVVVKLFNMVNPDIAYFGQKDYQQLLVIEKMVKDLNMPVLIRRVGIVREKDGLAMSSRNKYLPGPLRSKASSLYKSLLKAKGLIKNKVYLSLKIKRVMREIIKPGKDIKIDYIAIVDKFSLKDLPRIRKGKTLIAVAVYFKKTRLIDNILV